eukprot:7775997-Alexandrium_andersonii.AAC.1
MSASLVGSEMCIRDRGLRGSDPGWWDGRRHMGRCHHGHDAHMLPPGTGACRDRNRHGRRPCGDSGREARGPRAVPSARAQARTVAHESQFEVHGGPWIMGHFQGGPAER